MPVAKRYWRPSVNLASGVNHTALAAYDRYVHVIWRESGAVRYRRSIDYGATYSLYRIAVTSGCTEVPLTQPIAVDGTDIHFVYVATNKLYYVGSLDNGVTWSTPVELGDSGGLKFYRVGVGALDGIVHVGWAEITNGTETPAYFVDKLRYRRSANRGVSWGSEEFLYEDAVSPGRPAIAMDELGTVFFAWNDWRTGTEAYRGGPGESYVGRSFDGGLTWEEEIQVSFSSLGSDGGLTLRPEIVCQNEVVNVAWQQPTSVVGIPPMSAGDEDIWITRSADRGDTWDTPEQFTSGSEITEHLQMAGNDRSLYICWADYRNPSIPHTYHRESLDKGLTWGPESLASTPGLPTPAPRAAISRDFHLILTNENDNLTIARSLVDLPNEPDAPLFDDFNRANTGPPPGPTSSPKWRAKGFTTSSLTEGLVVNSNQLTRASGGAFRQSATAIHSGLGETVVAVWDIVGLSITDGDSHFLVGLRAWAPGVSAQAKGVPAVVTRLSAGASGMWEIWLYPTSAVAATITTIPPAVGDQMALTIGVSSRDPSRLWLARFWHKPVATGVWGIMTEAEITKTLAAKFKAGLSVDMVRDQTARIDNLKFGGNSMPRLKFPKHSRRRTAA